MEIMGNDLSKFRKIGLVNSCNNTNRIEINVQRQLLSIYESEPLTKMAYDCISLTGFRMYRLSKVNKECFLLRPILQ